MVTVRAYEAGDAARIAEFCVESFRPVFDSFRQLMGEGLFRRVHPDWEDAQARAVLKSVSELVTWVAVQDGAVVGFVSVVVDAAQRSGEIYMLAVDPAAQRQGVATQLSERALSEMRRAGVDLATVATGGDPGHAAARATYEKLGFVGVPQVWYAKSLG